jgi:ribosome-associated toxin RatA of RatAB toxin-antitoxin module
MDISIYEGSLPVKDAAAQVTLDSLGENQTRVSMEMNFTPKLGLIGKAMLPMMTRQFTGMINQLLSGNAAHVESRLLTQAA